MNPLNCKILSIIFPFICQAFLYSNYSYAQDHDHHNHDKSEKTDSGTEVKATQTPNQKDSNKTTMENVKLPDHSASINKPSHKDDDENKDHSDHKESEKVDHAEHGSEEKNGHAKHEEHEEGGHDEHEISQFGKDKAITRVENDGEKFELNEKAEKLLKIATSEIKAQGRKFVIPKSALVSFRDEYGVYVKRGNAYQLLETKKLVKTENEISIELENAGPIEWIVTQGVELLRVAHMQASGQGGEGHVH